MLQQGSAGQAEACGCVCLCMCVLLGAVQQRMAQQLLIPCAAGLQTPAVCSGVLSLWASSAAAHHALRPLTMLCFGCSGWFVWCAFPSFDCGFLCNEWKLHPLAGTCSLLWLSNVKLCACLCLGLMPCTEVHAGSVYDMSNACVQDWVLAQVTL